MDRRAEAAAKLGEKIIWQSKVIKGLTMTNLMLSHLRTNPSTAIVSRWDGMMADLEAYLIRKPEKMPKDFKKFVFNCARRRAQDVKEGKRYPDGRINLKAFEKKPEVGSRRLDVSLTKQLAVQEHAALRAKLATLRRGTKEYNDTLQQLKQKKAPALMSFGEIMKKISEVGQ